MANSGHRSRESAVLDTLLEKASLQGYLTSEDILESHSRGLSDPEQLIPMIAALRIQGVEILGLEDELPSLDSEDLLSGDEKPVPVLEHISSDDSVSLYMKEMSLTPLLTVEEEITLAQRIEKGSRARQEYIQLISPREPARRQELETIIQEGVLARDYLIKANTRLVVSIARKYTDCGVPFLDLIQEGNLGLMRAVEKYEYRRGFRFSTYATWWIRQSITRAIAEQGRTIRVPVHMTDRLRQMYKVSQEMEQALGRAPSAQELAKVMELDGSKVRWMLQVAQIPISLESPVGDEEDSELGLYVEDDSSPSPAQITYQHMLRERIELVLASLSPREARVLRLRYGLGYDRPYTLEEVGQKFGLTRERIRQIEGKALRRLRQPALARLLSEYM